MPNEIVYRVKENGDLEIECECYGYMVVSPALRHAVCANCGNIIDLATMKVVGKRQMSGRAEEG